MVTLPLVSLSSRAVQALRLSLLAGLVVTQAVKGAVAAYTIQVGAYQTLGEAEQVRGQFAAVYSPVFILNRSVSGVTEQYSYKVCAGNFSTYAEVWSSKERLPKTVFPGCFITSGTLPENVSPSAQLPIERPFSNPVSAESDEQTDRVLEVGGMGPKKSVSAAKSAVPVWQLGSADLLDASLNGNPEDGRTDEARERLLSERPGDSKSNQVRLRHARQLGHEKNYNEAEALLNHTINTGTADEKLAARFIRAHVKRYRGEPNTAFQEFRSLANASDVPPALRRRSMRLAAGSAHAAKNYPDAWFSFAQIAETDSNPEVIAEARMEQAGLAWELVLCGKGTWEETRALCDVVLLDPAAPHKTKATAAIMHLETWFFQENYTQCLSEVEQFMATYADVRREAGLVRVWRGLSLLNLRRIPEAKVALEEAATQELADNELFAGTDPRAVACSWLVFVARAQNDSEALQRWTDLLNTRYAGSNAALSIAPSAGSQ